MFLEKLGERPVASNISLTVLWLEQNHGNHCFLPFKKIFENFGIKFPQCKTWWWQLYGVEMIIINWDMDHVGTKSNPKLYLEQKPFDICRAVTFPENSLLWQDY